MNKKRFLSWVLIFTMLFSITAGMQKAEAVTSAPELNKINVFGNLVTATSGTGSDWPTNAADPYIIQVDVANSVARIATSDIVSVDPTPAVATKIFTKFPYTLGDSVTDYFPLAAGENILYVKHGGTFYKIIINRTPFISSKEINNIGLKSAYLTFTTIDYYSKFFYKIVEGENPVAPTADELIAYNNFMFGIIGGSLSGVPNTPQTTKFNVPKMGTKYTIYFLVEYGTSGRSEVASVSFTTKASPENCRILSVAGVSDEAPFGISISNEPISREEAVDYSISLPATVKTISLKDIKISDGATLEMFTVNTSGPEVIRKEERIYSSYAKVEVTDKAPMALYDGKSIVYAKVTNGSDFMYARILIDRAIDTNNPDIPASVKLLSVAGLTDGVFTAKIEMEGSRETIVYEYRVDAPNSLTQIVPSDIGIQKGSDAWLYVPVSSGPSIQITKDAPFVLKTGENIFNVSIIPYAMYSKSLSSGRKALGEKAFPGAKYRVIINRSEYSNKLTINAGTGGSVTTGKSGYFATGAVVTVVATANSGYKFKGWTTNHGGAFGNIANASTTFTVPEGNVDITASFVVNTTGGTTGGGGNERPSTGGTTGGGGAVTGGGGSAGGTTGGTTGGGTAGGGTAPSGKTEPGTAGNTGDAAKKLNDLMGKLGDKAQQGTVVDDAAKLLGDLSKATEEVKTNEGAVQAAGNVRDAINNASKIVNEVDAAGADAKIVGQVKDVLEASAQALDKITDDAAKLKATGDILAEGSKFLKNAGTAEGTEALKQELVDMAKKAVADASTSELKPTVTGGTVKAKITAEVAAELLKSAAQNAQAITELNKNLAEGGIKTALEKTVTLDLGENPDMKKLAAEMSGKVLSDLSKAGVKNLEIVSGDSSLKIKSDSVPAGTKSFSVEVKSVDTTQKGLSAAQKKFVETHTVIDINASITNAKGKTSNLTTLKSKVEVEIPYTLKEGQDPTKVEVYVKLDNGTFKKYIGTYNSETKSATVGVDRF